MSQVSETVLECPICLENIGDTNKLITSCGHTFHATCIFTNLHTCNTCPLCREVLDQPSSPPDVQNVLDNLEDEDIESFIDSLTNVTGNNARIAQDIITLISDSIGPITNDNIVTDRITDIVGDYTSEVAFDFTNLLRDWSESERQDLMINSNIQYINNIPDNNNNIIQNNINVQNYPINAGNSLGLTLSQIDNILSDP